MAGMSNHSNVLRTITRKPPWRLKAHSYH